MATLSPAHARTTPAPRPHSAGVSLMIAGVPIRFPFVPYAIQRLFMEKVIQCLHAGHRDMERHRHRQVMVLDVEDGVAHRWCRQNALLESPTGTGKTMSMLCAAHAWQLHMRAQHRSSSGRGVPRIFFASRTHSQLSHCVKELKRSGYSPSIAVLGSREQMCVHDHISDLRGARLNNACNSACRTGRCSFYTNARHGSSSSSGDGGGTGLMDIEDLAVWGRQSGVCPYYYSRSAAQHADIVFLPYNYLVDPELRRRMGIDVAGNVLVFDEAHNLHQFCSDAASFDLSQINIAQAVAEVGQAIQVVEDKVEELKETCDDGNGDDDDDDKEKEEETNVQRMKMTERNRERNRQRRQMEMEKQYALNGKFRRLQDSLLDLDEHLDSLLDNDSNNNNRNVNMNGTAGGITQPGDYIFELFSYMGVNSLTLDDFCRTVDEVNELLTSSTNLTASSASHSSGSNNTFGLIGLQTIRGALTRIFGQGFSEQSIAQSFRVHVGRSRRNLALGTNASQRYSQALNDRDMPSKDMRNQKVVSFWCFHPGLALSGMFTSSETSPMSIIFTSGTLSPMNSFEFEFGLKFPIRLENPHVIGPDQIEAITLSKGPTNVSFNSSFGKRDNEAYQREVGAVVLNMCRLVPEGLLVFFPSTTIMRKMLQIWERPNGSSSQTLMDSLRQSKEVFVEPEKSSDLQRVIADYENCIDRASNNVMTDQKRNGAVFFAVCRGRVSEGLDFRDSRGRGVIVIGLPFPPKEDPKVKLKREYMDHSFQTANLGIKDKQIDGQHWYMQECSRAVNQSIGRIIRHKNDFGFIVLCDERYERSNMVSQISKWLHPYMHNVESFGQFIRSVAQFFRRNRGNAGTASAQPGTGSTGIHPRVLSSSSSTTSSLPQERPTSSPITLSGVTQSRLLSQPSTSIVQHQGQWKQRDVEVISVANVDNVDSRMKVSTARPKADQLSHISSSPATFAQRRGNTQPQNVQIQKSQPASTATNSMLPVTNASGPASSATFSSKTVVHGFMIAAKSRLSAEEYAEFKKMLRDYREIQRGRDAKAKAMSFKNLCKEIYSLFGGDRVDLRERFAKNVLSESLQKTFARYISHYDTQQQNRQQNNPDKSVEVERGSREGNVGHKRSGMVLDLVTGTKVKRPRTMPSEKQTSVIDLDEDKDDGSDDRQRQNQLLTPPLMHPQQGQQQYEDQTAPAPSQSSLECPICRDVLDNPHAANCGHLCCLECWKTLLKNKLECPVCRSRVREKQLKRIHFA